MKLIGSVVVLSAVALAHPSGLWWGTDFCYPSPENTDNHCSAAQESGFDWSDLGNGDNWRYEGFSFNGFAPKDGCRASGGKCIEGKFSREDHYELQIDAEQAPFSVRKFHITTSRKVDIIMTYLLADGSTCRQIASTSPMGSDVVNEQCGGAVSVKFELSVLDQAGEVDMELHQMGFDCSSGPKPAGPLVAPPSPSTSAVSVPTVPVESHKPSTSVVKASTPTHEPPVVTVPVESHKPSTSVVKASTPTHEPPVVTASVVYTTRVVTLTRCPSWVTDCPAHATVNSTLSWPTTATGPVKQPPQTTVPPPVTTSAVPSSSSPPPCPDLVPKCLNTWLSIPKCESNSDAACFCPSSEFTEKFNSCVHACSSSQQQTDSALAYFAGICAPYVPKNPAIITIVPTSTPSSSVPVQHITGAPSPTGPIVSTTLAPEPPCTTLTWSSHTVTVPQVGFSTHTDASTTVVSLVTGNPATKSVKSVTSAHAHTTCKSSSTKVVVHKSTTPASHPTSTVTASQVSFSTHTTCTSSSTKVVVHKSTTPASHPTSTVTSPQVGFSTHTDAPTTVVSLVTSNPVTKSVTSAHAHTTCTSSFTKVVVHKSTTTASRPTSPSKSTPTVVLSNVGSKAFSGSLWALGLAVLILPLQ